MRNVSPADQTGFVAQQPDHSFACFRLIKAGLTYDLTIEQEVLCEDCARSDGVIRVRDGLVVESGAIAPW